MREENHIQPPRESGNDGSATPQLEISQTATGYWIVQQEGRHVTGAMTRPAAEAERELMLRLRSRAVRRNALVRP
ncbi:MAG TPA: hypothetical protein VFW29_02975 [Solirubrobacteraceae bacterium]|nr:hypothetical protein [Solirubrobacteraceae bacterium]